MANSRLVRSPAELKPAERAEFATSIRLLSCLVTESLVDALFYPLNGPALAGFTTIQIKALQGSAPSPHNTLAIVPLLHTPILRKGKDATPRSPAPTIGLLDPLDAAPFIFTFGDHSTSKASLVHAKFTNPSQRFQQTPLALTIQRHLSDLGWKGLTSLHNTYDPITLWRKYADAVGVEPALQKDIEGEFTSSVKWQSELVLSSIWICCHI